ncbi:hypothetical protein LEP1GSC185_0884 [Leptospira licerasiae serovar Varillal str. VAR 010]|uniref:Uncharacterized protein n=1 Tax=Leptospira licerasiae str. MMD4847 TaxID=1049971 RepID=A0ABP2RF49_9LEPT|nr:hypothetical protein LEP1GSC185_0884 [Leptospira licerasiae serovar Varillal str. VAR 010]EJZ43102.1 hypothetical protein LEP1GSC178_3666 [Leptospira licerasiae str. MMD4847]
MKKVAEVKALNDAYLVLCSEFLTADLWQVSEKKKPATFMKF